MSHYEEYPGYVLWMTGLSGAGKTTIALVLEEELKNRGCKFERLDGDVVRESLTRDLASARKTATRTSSVSPSSPSCCRAMALAAFARSFRPISRP